MLNLIGCKTNFSKSKKIGFRYSTPSLKGVNKSQFFSKSPLGDLGVENENLSYTHLILVNSRITNKVIEILHIICNKNNEPQQI